MHLILKCTYIPAVTQRKHTESNCWHFILKNLSRQFLFPFIWKLLVKCFRFLRIHQIPFRCCILSGNSIQIPRYQLLAQKEGCIFPLRQSMITDTILACLPETTLPIEINIPFKAQCSRGCQVIATKNMRLFCHENGLKPHNSV